MTIRSRSLLAAAALALTAGVVTAAPAAGPAPAAASDELSVSMVELLGDTDTEKYVTLDHVRTDLLGRYEAWRTSARVASTYSNGAGVDVALIDTGVAPVDGLTNVVHGPDLSGEGAVAEAAYIDTYGHGTHMAGIIAGQRDDARGIAPEARIVSVKVAGRDGITTVAQVVAAIDWVVEHRNTDGMNIRVLNLSLGQADVNDYRGDLLSAAVERAWHAGIFVVVAAGNRGAAQPHLDSPAIDPYVMAVGAIDSLSGRGLSRQQPTGFTAHGDGNRNPDGLAAGRSVASYRVPGSTADLAAPGARIGDDLFRGSGTSQSAAVISGLAARMIGGNSALDPDDVKATLTTYSYTASGAAANIVGHGAVHGSKALVAPREGEQEYKPAAGDGTGIAAPTGATWSGGGWSKSAWAGATWSGATWSGGTWSGATWSGATWSGATWSGATWSGATWSGATWSGATWSGATWSGATWSGTGWVTADATPAPAPAEPAPTGQVAELDNTESLAEPIDASS